MKTKKLILPLLGLLMTFLGADYAVADVSPSTVQLGVVVNSHVKICHRKGNGGYVLINPAVNGLNGHQNHTASGKKLADEYYVGNACGNSKVVPDTCDSDEYWDDTAKGGNGDCKECPSPSVVNSTYDGCITSSTPTVTSRQTDTNTNAWISGTVGTTLLGMNEPFKVSLNGNTYTYGTSSQLTTDDAATQFGWKLALSSTLPYNASGYPVTANRNGNSSNTGYLTVTCPTTLPYWDGSICKSTPVSPTVNSPTITFGTTSVSFEGNVGTNSTLAITVADTSVSSASVSNVTANSTWTYPASLPSTLAVGSHAVTVTGSSASSAVGTLTVQCPTNKPTWKNNDCVAETGVTPTITSIDGQTYSGTSIRTGNKKPTITGSLDAGSLPLKTLDNDTFVVTLKKLDKTGSYTTVGTYDKSMSALTTASGAALGAGSTDWKLVIPTNLDPGYKYEIEASRNGTPDTTHDELIVGIAVCDKSVSTTVPSYILYSEGTAIVESSTYYLGQCTPTATKPTFSNSLTQELTSDSCVGSKSTNITIGDAIVTQATIMNVTTIGGTIDLTDNASYKYGVKSAGGTMNISGATIASDGVASGVMLSNATLTNVYLDPKSGSIDVTGGTVKSSATSSTIAFNSDGTAATSTITDGIIKEGTNGGKAVRGRIVRGKNSTDISAITKGKRIKGTLTGATIRDVTTTTALDTDNTVKTFVMPSANTTIDVGASFTPEETFGNVQDVTIPTTGTTTITNATHCFSSGKVGERGQLNWKEKGQ